MTTMETKNVRELDQTAWKLDDDAEPNFWQPVLTELQRLMAKEGHEMAIGQPYSKYKPYYRLKEFDLVYDGTIIEVAKFANNKLSIPQRGNWVEIPIADPKFFEKAVRYMREIIPTNIAGYEFEKEEFGDQETSSDYDGYTIYENGRKV